MQKLNTNQEDRANSRCHGNIVCPGDIALVVTGASFTTTGEMKNSQFPVSASQPLHMNPAPPSLSRIHFPSLCRCTHLRQTNLHVCLLFSQRNPSANSAKLFIVRRQLPPGVLVSQKALQMQWEISFLRFILFIFLILKKRRQM